MISRSHPNLGVFLDGWLVGVFVFFFWYWGHKRQTWTHSGSSHFFPFLPILPEMHEEPWSINELQVLKIFSFSIFFYRNLLISPAPFWLPLFLIAFTALISYSDHGGCFLVALSYSFLLGCVVPLHCWCSHRRPSRPTRWPSITVDCLAVTNVPVSVRRRCAASANPSTGTGPSAHTPPCPARPSLFPLIHLSPFARPSALVSVFIVGSGVVRCACVPSLPHAWCMTSVTSIH